MAHLPTVSILIPCYNAERWVAQAIQSAIDQTYGRKEVIVIDDGSTDGSLEIIKSFGNFIRWESGPNRGGNSARNRLLELSRGEWLQYLDADDYLLPGKIESQVNVAKIHPESDVIFSPVLFEEWLNDEGPRPVRLSPMETPIDPWILLARWQLPQTGGSLWKRNAVIRCGRWDESLPCCQEHDLYLRLLKNGCRFSHCDQSEAVYRYWPGATVSRRDPSLVLTHRLRLLDQLLVALRDCGQLLESRVRAVNTTKFEIARSLWPSDRLRALEIIRHIHESDSAFTPSGPASPRMYRALYQMIGFRMTEHVASWVRNFFPPA